MVNLIKNSPTKETKKRVSISEKETLQSYPCPICGKDDFASLYEINKFQIVSCKNCKMVCVNPRIANDDIFKMYEHNYFFKKDYSFHDLGYGDYELTAELRRKTFVRWLSDVEPYLSIKKGNALDIGCGTGIFMNILKEKNWNVKGIELDKTLQPLFEQKGFNVSTIPLEQYTSPEKFHLITLFDVIEHLPNPDKNFEKLREHLDDNGSILIVTPNIASIQKKIVGPKWFQFKPKEHIYYYSPSTLAKLAEKYSLKVKFITHCGQYADLSFLEHRINRYNFRFLSAPVKFLKWIGLMNRIWYVQTGSMLAVIQKK